MLRPQAKSRGIKLHFKNLTNRTLGNVMHSVDEMRVKQVLVNLLSNAIKFSKALESIEISLEVTEGEETDIVALSVVDTGVGMSQQDMDKLFKPYMKTSDAKSKKANPYGNGLGLSISQNIAKALGGEIKAKSALGRGSKFKFQFPAKRADLAEI